MTSPPPPDSGTSPPDSEPPKVPAGRRRNTAQELDRFQEAFRRFAQSLEDNPDRMAGFRIAGDAAQIVQNMADELGTIRARLIAQIYRSDRRLSLAHLAERLGLSKSRTAQLVATSKTQDETTEEKD